MNYINVFLCCYFITTTLFAQTIPVSFAKLATSPRDTSLRVKLQQNLSGLLSHSDPETNPYIASECKLETSLLLDEMNNLRLNTQYKDSLFYQCEIINYIKVSDSNSIVQIAYTGAHSDTVFVRALFTMYAFHRPEQFVFYSPLQNLTTYWRKTKLNNVTVYHKGELNKKNAQRYFDLVDRYDTKLKAPKLPITFYCCDHFNEALKVSGTDFKSDYTGYSKNNLRARNKERELVVGGAFAGRFDDYDPHDLWHVRLHNVLSTNIINRPVDEGTAYLYGGSWGLTWEDILTRFKTYAAANPNADWYALYNESKNFDEKFKYPLNVDFAINALLVNKIEKEKGFDAVLALLSCGKKQKDNQNYFTALEKITGIQQTQFNTAVWELIRNN